jgi:hypothetical protein
MRRSIEAVAIIAFLCAGMGCHRVEEDDLTGRFLFDRDSLRMELQLNADHTYHETVTQANTESKSNGTWDYQPHYNLGDLNLTNVWVPFVPLGSNTTQPKKTSFSFGVEQCGSKLCLIVSDNDPPLRFVKE